jgi:AmmeMemoRadiSam system protein B
MRHAVFAGSFYPDDEREIARQLAGFFAEAKAPGIASLRACVAPHAGWLYSGAVAAHAYKAVRAVYHEPPVFVIVCPNHTGTGAGIALSLQDWETPLGVAKCDAQLAKAIKRNCALAEIDESAHAQEHAIEVHLPFLQFLYGEVRFVAACMMLHGAGVAKELAAAIAKSTAKRGVLVLASSDFTHFESAESSRMKDALALEAIKRLDAQALERVVERQNATICGYAPIMVAIEYAKQRGAKKAEVLEYANSGDVTGDYSSVVGYASVVM